MARNIYCHEDPTQATVKPGNSPIERRHAIIQRCLAIIAIIGVGIGLLVDRLSPTPLQPFYASRFFGVLEVPGRITPRVYVLFRPTTELM